MKEWMSAQEIADEKLPQMPTTQRGVKLFAERQKWDAHPYARKRAGSVGGGGMEYKYMLLPLQAQIELMRRYRVIGDETAEAGAADVIMSANLPDKARLERDARLAILAAYDDFLKGVRAQNRAPNTALNLFAIKYNNRSLQVKDWVRGVIPSISPRSIMRWRATAKKDADALAVDRSKGRKGSGVLETANEGAVKAFIIAWIAKAPHLAAATIRDYCELQFGAEITVTAGVFAPLPPLRTFQHFIKQLKADNKVVLTKITNPDSYRSTMRLAGTGTYRHITEPNALWMIDASPMDALCLDGRWSIYVCVDIATRRTVITLSRTPRAAAVALMIRKATLKWGVASIIKTDNGSDFKAYSIAQLFDALDIEADPSDAYSPEQKGHVERAIKTFQHQVAPQLPGYIGHSVADRKAIEGRKAFSQRLGADEKELFEVALTGEQLQTIIDDWLEFKYHETEHEGLKRRTPNEVAAASLARPRMVDERALDVLLMPVAGKDGRRKMTKQGIKIDRMHYLCGSIMVGDDVIVRMDPIDMGKAYVFSGEDGRFLDVALCPELANVNPADFVRAQKQLQADIIGPQEKQIKADIRELRKGPSGIERTIQLAKSKFEAKQQANHNVVALPKRTEEHTTPQIAAALEAANASERNFDPTPLSPEVADLHAMIQRDEAMKNVVPIRHNQQLTEAGARFKRATQLEFVMAAGRESEIDPEELRWLAGYRKTPEYQTGVDISEDFGLEQAFKML